MTREYALATTPFLTAAGAKPALWLAGNIATRHACSPKETP
ncbi:hypothetical protein ACXIZN_25420 [Amycolatopsis sp. TRM77291]